MREEHKGTIVEEYASQMMTPPTGAAAERQSFMQQASNMNTTSYRVPMHIVKEVAELYPKSRVPWFISTWNEKEGPEEFDRAFRVALSAMDADKSPGAFWDKIASDNQGVITLAYDKLKDEVHRLATLVIESDFEDLIGSELFKTTGIVYKLFVKGELHTREKIEEGRQRLIFSSPLHMTILERMWFQPQNDAEIKAAGDGELIPSRPGTPFTSEGAHVLKECVSEFKNRLVSTDQKGWDVRVPGWLMDADIKRRFHCLEGSQESKGRWLRGAMNLNHIVKFKVVAFSDGHFVYQKVAGWWPSGSYRTSGSNSGNRVIIRRVAAGDCEAITMGDDAVEGWLEDLYQRYAKYGFTLKHHEFVIPSDFEFCSKHFMNGIVVPVETSVRKMILNVYRHDSPEARSSIKQELKYYDNLDEFIRLGILDPDPTISDWQ